MTMFDFQSEDIFLKSCISLMPDVIAYTPFQKLHISLLTTQNISQKLRYFFANVK